MNTEERIKKLNWVINNCNEFKDKDKLIFMLAVEDLMELVEELYDKYDVSKPFRFEVRRLDEL